jgi:uncharacterized protein (TIGR04222 family)
VEDLMLATATGTWGITGEQFLTGYGALCAATAAGVWRAYVRALGPPAGPMDPLPALETCQIALLNAGPDAATTAAAARLYCDGLVRAEGPALVATGELDAGAEPIEREVHEIVSREPWLTRAQLRDRVRDGATMRSLRDQLARDGLVLDAAQARSVRRLWLAPALVTTLGVIRILAGLAAGRPILVLAIMAALAGAASAWLALLRPEATTRGRDVLERLRGEHDAHAPEPGARQIALTAALFGAGTLWLAESTMASALDVPREEEPTVGRQAGGWGGWSCGGGGGGCGGGCGGGGCGG